MQYCVAHFQAPILKHARKSQDPIFQIQSPQNHHPPRLCSMFRSHHKTTHHSLQIRRAYRALISKEHPDKGGSPERFASIKLAYEILSSAPKRAEYNATGKVVKTIEEEFVDSFAGGTLSCVGCFGRKAAVHIHIHTSFRTPHSLRLLLSLNILHMQAVTGTAFVLPKQSLQTRQI
jgi:hypothetical protein